MIQIGTDTRNGQIVLVDGGFTSKLEPLAALQLAHKLEALARQIEPASREEKGNRENRH
jgi:hypothetical protein